MRFQPHMVMQFGTILPMMRRQNEGMLQQATAACMRFMNSARDTTVEAFWAKSKWFTACASLLLRACASKPVFTQVGQSAVYGDAAAVQLPAQCAGAARSTNAFDAA